MAKGRGVKGRKEATRSPGRKSWRGGDSEVRPTEGRGSIHTTYIDTNVIRMRVYALSSTSN